MNPDHKPQKKLLFGCSGSGKSTLFHKLIQSPGYRYRYVFDWDLKVARTLGWMASTTVEGLCRLQDAGKPVLFYPREMFADLEEAFAFWCRFVLRQAEGRQGKKLFGADEVQEYVNPNFYGLAKSIKQLLNYGRNEEVDMVLAAASIVGMPSRMRAQTTEIYIFKHGDLDTSGFKALKDVGIDPDSVKALPHVSTDKRVGWIYRHCLTGRMETITYAINGKTKADRH